MSSISSSTSSSTSGSSAASGLNFTGLASGIDTSTIITGLTALNQQRIDNYKSQESTITSKQTIFAALNSSLVNIQSSIGSLARSIGGAFEGRTITSSDDTSVTGVGSSSAVAGSYNITVNQLAQANQVASSQLSDQSTNIQTGTVTIQSGAGTPITVTVDSKNNTLQGLANSINDAAGDVRASVVGDSSGYRLLLTGTKTGAANTISVTNNLTGGTGASLNLTERQVQNAADAQVTLGTGSGAITVGSAINRVDNLIAGVSLNLAKADPTKTLTVNVAPDSDTASKAIGDFVTAYNTTIDFINDRSSYDTTTQTAGVFLGDRDITNLKNDLASAVGSAINGANPKLNRMSAIGLTFNDNGELAFDSSKLTAAINGQVDGVSAADVKSLFAFNGTASNSGTNFLLGGTKTKPTPAGQPYQVNITQAASRASILGSTALPASMTLDSSNNTFNIQVNNLSPATLTLAPGSYTPASLASALQTQLNGRYGTNTVTADLDSGRLRLMSTLYGSTSQVGITGGSGLSLLGFTGAISGVGTNVAGSYTVAGKTEAASGSGQVLTGNPDNANTAGLQIRASYTEDQVSAGTATSDLTVTQGLASRLSQVLDKYTDPISGRFKTIDDGFNQSVATIETTITKENQTMSDKKAALVQQFAGLETSVSTLKNVGSQIAASFGVLSYK
ncbi:flagellar filament capping protein FliD [Zavarzinella formosa]|uniref:flagellar filament capping protein FliD n=1 Tax=Zavarzinella formosa TaxID=360055 RepID=UPI00030AE3D3|nr:flagellar filament capping protein FliD [Zavarzinella formosa]